MLDIDVINDEELQDSINPFISSLLPHEDYDSAYYSENLGVVFKYIHLDEFKLEYRLLFSALMQLNRIKISIEGFRPELTRKAFEKLLETSIYDAVMDSTLGVVEMLKYEGRQTNLHVESVREEACQFVCARCLELYDVCYGIGQASSSVLNREPELRAAFMAHVGAHSINIQSSIVSDEVRIGRKKYSGFDDWLSYTSLVVMEIRSRLSAADSDQVVLLDSMEGSIKLLGDLKRLFVPIAEWGIPQFDDYTPILCHRFVIAVGNENIGKTKFAVDKAVNVILAGGCVEYMCGESQKAKVYGDIIINYVWKKYSLIIKPSHVAAPDECPEDVRKVIGMAIDYIVNYKLLILRDSFNYATVYDELVSDYERYQFRMCVVDHSCALVGTYGDGSLKAKLTKLSEDCKMFRKNYPVCMLVTSHPSAAAKDAISRDQAVTQSPTKESQSLSTDADEVFILRDNEALRKQNLIKIENYKRRDAAVAGIVVLRKKFEVSAFIYDEKQQADDTRAEMEKQEALRIVDEMYEESLQDDEDSYLD